MLKILPYIILWISIFFVIPESISAQEKADTTKTNTPLYQGFTVELNVVSLAEKLTSNGVSYSYEGNVQFNLKRKFFPVIQIGYGGADKVLINQTSFSGKGMYEKIGVDFNLMKQKKNGTTLNNYLLAGIRLGTSRVNYSIINSPIYNNSNYWGETLPDVNYNSIISSNFWLEISGGIRVEIYKNIILGWNIQSKHLLNNISNGNIYPWYIPGYGKTATSVWGFSYIIGYRF